MCLIFHGFRSPITPGSLLIFHDIHYLQSSELKTEWFIFHSVSFTTVKTVGNGTCKTFVLVYINFNSRKRNGVENDLIYLHRGRFEESKDERQVLKTGTGLHNKNS